MEILTRLIWLIVILFLISYGQIGCHWHNFAICQVVCILKGDTFQDYERISYESIWVSYIDISLRQKKKKNFIETINLGSSANVKSKCASKWGRLVLAEYIGIF